MRIGELARLTKLPASRIRFYEAEGLIPKVERGTDGYRDFPEDTAVSLRWIAIAQELGFSMREIRASLTDTIDVLPSKPDMLRALRAKLKSVDEHIEKLHHRRALMTSLLGELEIDTRPSLGERPRSARDVRADRVELERALLVAAQDIRNGR